MRLFVTISALFLICACANQQDKEVLSVDDLTPIEQGFQLSHAEGFDVEFFEEGTLIKVHRAWKEGKESFLYFQPNEGFDIDLKEAEEIPSDIKRIGCMSTTHIYALELLGREELLLGMSGLQNLSSEYYLSRVEAGNIIDLGSANSPDYELIVSLDLDLLVMYGIGNEILPITDKLTELEVPFVMNAEYLESHPLGQAEWLKFFGVFLGLNDEAQAKFEEIESNYFYWKEIGNADSSLPIAIINAPWEGIWYLPSKGSFSSSFLSDAGYTYCFEAYQEDSWFSLDQETVMAEGGDAQYWFNTGNQSSLEELEMFYPLAPEFEAFQSGMVFNNVKGLNEAGGNDYWESGIYRPDLVLEDLVRIKQGEVNGFNYYMHLK